MKSYRFPLYFPAWPPAQRDPRCRGIKHGTLPDIIRKTLETVRAEAAHFTTMDGQRTMLAVFDLKAASDIPRIAEPLFMGPVDFVPCMNGKSSRPGYPPSNSERRGGAIFAILHRALWVTAIKRRDEAYG